MFTQGNRSFMGVLIKVHMTTGLDKVNRERRFPLAGGTRTEGQGFKVLGRRCKERCLFMQQVVMSDGSRNNDPKRKLDSYLKERNLQSDRDRAGVNGTGWRNWHGFNGVNGLFP